MCTSIRFTDKSGHYMYLGRNLDWSCGYGERVVVTPRGVRPASPFGATPEVKYPIIGMGIIEEGQPLYFDCGNDQGLAVAGLNFPGYAMYEKDGVAGKTNVSSWEFPLWVCANFSTVNEVEEALDNVAIVDKPVTTKYPTSLLHWIIGDEQRSIVVEYRADGMHVFHDQVNVLANQPGFAWHEENLRNYMNVCSDYPEGEGAMGKALRPFGSGSMQRGLPGDYYSTSRFVRAAYVNANYPEQEDEAANVSRMFHSLQQVAMVDGCARMGNGDFEKTIYTGLFSSRTNTYYYNTYDDQMVRSYALADYPQEGDAPFAA